jgi:hypothetical protein
MMADIYMDVERHLNATLISGSLRRRKMAQTKFLITGATGDTGGYTVAQLLEKSLVVRVLAP